MTISGSDYDALRASGRLAGGGWLRKIDRDARCGTTDLRRCLAGPFGRSASDGAGAVPARVN